MARRFTGDTLVIATHNPGKVVEIGALLKSFSVTTKSAGAMGLPEPEETETTFEGNARLKALAAATECGLPSLADDSGLCINGLNGDPGVYSANWAGPNKDFRVAMNLVHQRMLALGMETSTAYFVCVLALAWPDGHVELFRGEVHGRVIWPPRGTLGFGYDPMFIADGETETFGEMLSAKKHAMSHRARAFDKLVEACFA